MAALTDKVLLLRSLALLCAPTEQHRYIPHDDRFPTVRSTPCRTTQNRRAIAQSGHAGRHGLLERAPLSGGIPLRSEGDRNAQMALVADSQSGHPLLPPAKDRRQLRPHLGQGEKREP